MDDPRRRLIRNPMVTAAVATLVASALLALAVWSTWRGGAAPSPQPARPTAIAALGQSTPTPRAIRFATPTPEVSDEGMPTEAPESVAAPAGTPESAALTSDAAAPPSDTTPPPAEVAVVLPSIDEGLTPAAATPAAAAPFADFADTAALGEVAGGSWQMEDGLLTFAGAGGAEPWLAVPGVSPSGDFAIEVEARVSDLSPGVCNQSFGLIAGVAGGTVWGGGPIYPCDGPQPVARITDATDWRDGYDQDQTLARAPFTPGNGWHTYRLELRGGSVLLTVDGKLVVQAPDARGEEQRAAPGQVGIWSQGVRLDVRRITVEQH